MIITYFNNNLTLDQIYIFTETISIETTNKQEFTARIPWHGTQHFLSTKKNRYCKQQN